MKVETTVNGDLQQPDIVSVWDCVTSTYKDAQTDGPDYQAHLRVLLDCAGNPDGRLFCEVGCGSGSTSAKLEKLGANTVLVDLSLKALGFARSYYLERSLNAQLCQQNALKLAFRDNTFDMVWNAGVIEHFQDDGKVALIQEMYRVVRPGGVLWVSAPNALDVPYRLAKRISECLGTWKFGYEDSLTAGRFVRLAERAGLKGFEVFSFNPIVGWWFLPYGARICDLLHLNRTVWHARRSWLGHVLCLAARKPEES